MRLSLRRTQPLEPATPAYDPGRWGPRLAPIGRALDGYQTPLRDIAVSIAGSTALVVALSWQAGRSRDGWIPVDFGLLLDEAPAVRYDHPPNRASWEDHMRVLGQAFDLVPGLKDPLILDLDEGFVVTATANGKMVCWEVDRQ